MRRGYLLYALAAAIATLAVALLASGALAPSLTVETYVHGKPVNAEVQVLALLPPGSPDPIVEAWNGTSSNGAAEVPLSALYGVARRWAAEGFGDTRVGIEVIITYTNGSTAWYGMHFTTYEPNAVIGEEENPVNAVAAAVGGGWRMVTQANDSITIEPRGGGASLSIPTPPTPSGCLWLVDWSWQSNETYIPLIWAEYSDGNAFTGSLFSYASSSQSVSLSFSASAAVPTGSSAKPSIGFQIIGTSLGPDTTSSYDSTGFGVNNPSLAAMYTRGTVGVAELGLWCPIDRSWFFTGEYANESYVQSSNFQAYPSSQVGTSNLTNFLSELGKYYTLNPVPFDEVALTQSGQEYGFVFSNVQQYSPFAFSASIPVGAIALALAGAAGVDIPVTAAIAAGLTATVKETTTTVTIIGVNLAMESNPAFGDVLMAQLPIKYTYDGHSFYPPLTGVYVEPFGHYSSSTTTSVGPGGTIDDPICMPPHNWTGSVSVFIGSSPLMVPGGSVDVSVAGPNGYSASYAYSMPPHEPLSITLPMPAITGKYTITVDYGPYSTYWGTIYYGPSSASTTVEVDVTPCS